MSDRDHWLFEGVCCLFVYPVKRQKSTVIIIIKFDRFIGKKMLRISWTDGKPNTDCFVMCLVT